MQADKDTSMDDLKQRASSFFTLLPGRWNITRRFEGEVEGLEGHFAGHAEFAVDPNGLSYHEELKVVPRSTSYQDYLYKFQDGQIIIHKVLDGFIADIFMTLRFQEGDNNFLVAEDSHNCNQDVYKGRFTICNSDEFEISYLVRGPKKSYSITTQYTRATS